MTQPGAPNVGADLVRIHRVITRGLEVTIEQTRPFAQDLGLEAAAGEGFASYVKTLVSVLHAHHLTEDEAAFPYFRLKGVEAPFDRLAAEHAQMAAILAGIGPLVDRLTGTAGEGDLLRTLCQALTQVSAIWRPHIRREEEHLGPGKLAALISDEEQMDLARRFAASTQEHARPDYWVVPFILYNLAPEDRAVMAQNMPPAVTQQLVPVVWRDRWAPMKPFLLD